MAKGMITAPQPEAVEAGAIALKRGDKAHVDRFDPTEVPKDTTHVCVIDADGNCASMTHSLGMPSGAIAAPRFTANSDAIDVVNRIPHFVTDELAAMGYPVARSHLSYAFAGVHAIKIDDGVWTGAADPGRDGMALQV